MPRQFTIPLEPPTRNTTLSLLRAFPFYGTVVKHQRSSSMSGIATFADERIRCPRCTIYPVVQSAVELLPEVHYLTLRCPSCFIVYDAQVPFAPAQALTESTFSLSAS